MERLELVTEEWDSEASCYRGAVEDRRTELDTDELVGPVEIAQRLSVVPNTVHQWSRRANGFPAPVARLSAAYGHKMSIWRWSEVAQWARETGRLAA